MDKVRSSRIMWCNVSIKNRVLSHASVHVPVKQFQALQNKSPFSWKTISSLSIYICDTLGSDLGCFRVGTDLPTTRHAPRQEQRGFRKREVGHPLWMEGVGGPTLEWSGSL